MNVIDELKRHDSLYAIGRPEISDRAYDILKAKARMEFPKHPYFMIIGAPVKGEKVKLPVVLGSLNKVKLDTVQAWMESQDTDYFVYWAKLDGVSLYKSYVNGKLVKAITRGDGEYGKDVTAKAMLFCKLELDDKTFTGELRSEVMLIGDTYKELGYTTRRNGAAGLINQDSLDNVEKLVCLTYELISDNKRSYITEMDRITRMEHMGVDVAPYKLSKVKTNKELEELLKEYKSNCYDVDGIVIVNNNSEREDTYYPDAKCAFKVNEEAIPCTVVDVEWNVTRTGRIVPVVVIEPTVIGGVMVERATGFNAKFIQDNEIRKGTIVNVFRANEVIPYIDSVESV